LPSGYTSFEAEYPATKGAIAKISTIGCDGSAFVGTGFAIDAHHIVTAGHVIEGSKSMTVTFGGNPVPTQIVGLDASGDVALLESDSLLPAPYIPLGDSAPGVGERVAAIGFPLGGDLTITQGSVSALGQSITVNNNQLAGLVQTDTALNPGNSGGPLVALDGTARGIVDALNTQANATGYAIAPQYARSEVQHWITSPESHPLPLCTAPDPYGSVQENPPSPSTTAPPPTVPAVPTVSPPGPSGRLYEITQTTSLVDGPSLSANQLATVPVGAQVGVQCKQTGDTYTGIYGPDSNWDQIVFNGTRGYVTDEWVNTQSDEHDNTAIPSC
jgi:S1-C subfamily serine protease